MSILVAQKENKELIVRFDPAYKVADKSGFYGKVLVPALNIHLYAYPSEEDRNLALVQFQRRSNVLAVEPNRVVKPRAEPNDDRYLSDQGNLLRVGYDKAWDLTPGGRTAEGEEIVVAILDAGFDVNHSDLRENLWINLEENFDDPLDNDGNGYINDVHGWDMTNDDNELPGNTHGTQVIGILGAKGNNNLGIAGTNWDIKMMLFSINSVANIVEAYGYILAQRRLYNSSGGERGALVVATNASFGIEGGTCDEFPVWGEIYNDLGREGILTAASTANRAWDVDMNGDMPTDCTSDFLIGVANLGTNDRLYQSSGWGGESIDLAAPGEDSFTTRPNGTYGSFASTSAAAPYVTGAIALLYATPCPSLSTRMHSDPAGTALLIRDALLSGILSNPALEFRTSSGGSLDVAEAQRRLAESCSVGDREEFAITNIYPNPASRSTLVETNAIVFSDGATVDLFDSLGRLVRSQRPARISSAPVRLEVNLDGLPSGWYTLRLEERDRVAVDRIVVR